MLRVGDETARQPGRDWGGLEALDKALSPQREEAPLEPTVFWSPSPHQLSSSALGAQSHQWAHPLGGGSGPWWQLGSRAIGRRDQKARITSGVTVTKCLWVGRGCSHQSKETNAGFFPRAGTPGAHGEGTLGREAGSGERALFSGPGVNAAPAHSGSADPAAALE